MWAVGGGKGGVGKSCISTNLSVRLAQLGQRVVIVDADLGGANLDTLLGCQRPKYTLSHFFGRHVETLGDLAVATGVDGLSLIAGDSETLGSANPQHAQKLKLIRHLRQLDADIVILDLGAGTTFNTLDLYLAADSGLVVTTPEPTAVQNCFAFVKAATLRDLEQRTGVKRRAIDHSSLRKLSHEGTDAKTAMIRTTQLIVNRANGSEARRVSNLLHDLTGRFLGGKVRLMGSIPDDPMVAMAVRRMVPVCVASPGCRASLELTTLAKNLLAPPQAKPHSSRHSQGPAMGVNEDVVVHGRRLHVQTEDLGTDQAAIRTQIFSANGGVIYSRRTPYMDAFFHRLGIAESERVRFHHVAIRKALEQGRISLASERRSA